MVLDEIETLITSIIKNLDSRIMTKLEDWGKTVRLVIDDESYYINFSNGLQLFKGETNDPNFSITSSLPVFSDILKGKINPVEAVVSGEIVIDGSLTEALEFSEIINESNLVSKDK